jgi:branched-chain amino acid transport system permease protein
MIGTFGSLFALGWIGLDVGESPPTGFGLLLAFGFALAVAMAASGGTALAIERLAYRPLRRRNAPRLAALITAIGLSLVISEAFALWRGRDVERLPTLIESKQWFSFLDAEVFNKDVIAVVAAVVMMVALNLFVGRTRLGRGIRAVAQDAETATLMGVNIDRVIQVTFLLGGLMAGAAGLLFMVEYEITRFNIGFALGVKAFTAAVLGGIGNLRGAFLGGLVLGLIENYGSGLFGSEWRDVIAFVVLVAVLMFRPTGILGESLGKARV